jgi:PDZ domain-containing protein
MRGLLLRDLDLPFAGVRVEPTLHRVNGDALIIRDSPRFPSSAAIYAPSFHLELRPTLRQVAGHALLRDASVIAKQRVLQGLSPDEYEIQGLREQDRSVKTAIFAACHFLGMHPSTSGTGVLVERVEPGGPCDGLLHRGDVITSARGVDVATVEELFATLSRERDETPTALRVVSAQRSEGSGGTRVVEVTADWSEDRPRLGLVASTHQLAIQLPIDADIDLPLGTAGPSAGLAIALSVIDALLPGGVTGGIDIAATGTVDSVGNIGAVGGVRLKSAAVAKCRVVRTLLVPAADAAEARQACAELEVIPVTSLAETVSLLGCR